MRLRAGAKPRKVCYWSRKTALCGWLPAVGGRCVVQKVAGTSRVGSVKRSEEGEPWQPRRAVLGAATCWGLDRLTNPSRRVTRTVGVVEGSRPPEARRTRGRRRLARGAGREDLSPGARRSSRVRNWQRTVIIQAGRGAGGGGRTCAVRYFTPSAEKTSSLRELRANGARAAAEAAGRGRRSRLFVRVVYTFTSGLQHCRMRSPRCSAPAILLRAGVGDDWSGRRRAGSHQPRR